MPFNFFQKFWGKKSSQAPKFVKERDDIRRESQLPHEEAPDNARRPSIVAATHPKGKSDSAAQLLIQPHISEKSTEHAESETPTYVFRVAESASKPILKKMIEDRYDVKVQKVRTSYTPATMHRRGAIVGKIPGFKKAVITLAKGNRIDEF